MASKITYTLVAVIGIAAASGVAWWYQNKAQMATVGIAGNDSATNVPTSANQVKSSGATASAGTTAGATAAAKPPSVESAKVEVMTLTDDTQAVGSLKSRQSVVLRPEVSGRITQLNFRDGDKVKKGQLLVQFDDQLQMAQVKQSQAELSIALANHKRNQDLVAQNFISKRSVDESAANLEVAQAKLSLAQATAARLKITAPFNGLTGIRNVNVGDYLKDGGDIVNIEDISAVFVDFRLPERFQTKVKEGQNAQVDMDALPGRKFNAVIQAIDPLVDANGRSVGVRACIDNRQNQLRPGMFARVNAVFGERNQAKVVPEEAIVPLGGKQYVIKLIDVAVANGVDKNSKVTQRIEVKVGLRRPGRVEITEGLNEGDEVVTAGQQRIQKDGTVVKVLDLSRGGSVRTTPNPASPSVATVPSTGVAATQSALTSVPVVAEPTKPNAAISQNLSMKKPAIADTGSNPCFEVMPPGRV